MIYENIAQKKNMVGGEIVAGTVTAAMGVAFKVLVQYISDHGIFNHDTGEHHNLVDRIKDLFSKQEEEHNNPLLETVSGWFTNGYDNIKDIELPDITTLEAGLLAVLALVSAGIYNYTQSQTPAPSSSTPASSAASSAPSSSAPSSSAPSQVQSSLQQSDNLELTKITKMLKQIKAQKEADTTNLDENTMTMTELQKYKKFLELLIKQVIKFKKIITDLDSHIDTTDTQKKNFVTTSIQLLTDYLEKLQPKFRQIKAIIYNKNSKIYITLQEIFDKITPILQTKLDNAKEKKKKEEEETTAETTAETTNTLSTKPPKNALVALAKSMPPELVGKIKTYLHEIGKTNNSYSNEDESIQFNELEKTFNISNPFIKTYLPELFYIIDLVSIENIIYDPGFNDEKNKLLDEVLFFELKKIDAHLQDLYNDLDSTHTQTGGAAETEETEEEETEETEEEEDSSVDYESMSLEYDVVNSNYKVTFPDFLFDALNSITSKINKKYKNIVTITLDNDSYNKTVSKLERIKLTEEVAEAKKYLGEAQEKLNNFIPPQSQQQSLPPVQTPPPPIQAQVQTPATVQTPVQAPVQAPIQAQSPIQAQVQAPVQAQSPPAPVQTPAPVQAPVQAQSPPVQTPVQTQAQLTKYNALNSLLTNYKPKNIQFKDVGQTIDINYKAKNNKTGADDLLCTKRVNILVDTLTKFQTNRVNYYNFAKANMLKWCKYVLPRDSKGMEVIVRKADWGDMALECTKKYRTIFACLNMANSTKPGGGYEHGMAAQEENMFRRTDCHFFITRNKMLILANNTPPTFNYNPSMQDLIEAKTNKTYLDVKQPRVCIKGCETLTSSSIPNINTDIGYADLSSNEMFLFHELRCAAVFINRKKGHTFNEVEMKKRICAQFETLKGANIRHAILSAFGCGAFNNPPKEVAKLYQECLKLYKADFDVIAFPIYYAGNSPENYDEFRKVLLPNITDVNIHNIFMQ